LSLCCFVEDEFGGGGGGGWWRILQPRQLIMGLNSPFPDSESGESDLLLAVSTLFKLVIVFDYGRDYDLSTYNLEERGHVYSKCLV
jgi:hypothetical protein